ncbi:hypothetical protein C8R45DRAFT_276073 [Mycena sanguinolenta]|nr:hypothetical protein C8R45DRAFT_276073 [Mycena sanguinolenta]
MLSGMFRHCFSHTSVVREASWEPLDHIDAIYMVLTVALSPHPAGITMFDLFGDVCRDITCTMRRDFTRRGRNKRTKTIRNVYGGCSIQLLMLRLFFTQISEYNGEIPKSHPSTAVTGMTDGSRPSGASDRPVDGRVAHSAAQKRPFLRRAVPSTDGSKP